MREFIVSVAEVESTKKFYDCTVQADTQEEAKQIVQSAIDRDNLKHSGFSVVEAGKGFPGFSQTIACATVKP